MEKTVDNLEAMFQKAETDLNYLTRKLDFQLENEKSSSSETNPLRLMKQIEEIKTEYAALSQDMAAIQKTQKETVDFFRTQLETMTQMVGKLESQTGVQPELAESTVAQFDELSQLLGIPKGELLPGPPPETEGDENKAVEQSGASEGATASDSKSSTNSREDNAKQEPDEPPVVQMTAAERRAGCKECLDVTNEEFMSVSDLIRGRAKLDDVNRTYRLLWQHFKEEGNRKALTPKEMNSMGLRVTGATGEAKLKILRALKLCQISKNGDVKLS